MLNNAQLNFLNSNFLNWTEKNKIIYIKGNISISNNDLKKIPVQFGNLDGYFKCDENILTTLIGCPVIIKKSFNCNDNKLSTLKGGPKEVGEFYLCDNNKLSNLIGAAEICNGDFSCNSNKLTSLEGCPIYTINNFFCEKNLKLNILYGLGHIKGNVYYDNRSDLNEWIINRAKRNIFSTYLDISEWIKRNNKLEYLLYSQKEIRELFSPRILHLVDNGIFNESKILNYKNFMKIC